MAYKITKYRGKHKIKDTKTGKSVEVDIEKFMNGGSVGDEDDDKKKKKKENLSSEQVQDIRDTTGVQFTEAGANRLFELRPEIPQQDIPNFDLGRYKDVGYFNLNYSNNEFTISPTKANPGNRAKYEEYLDYLQKLNPDVKINRRPNNGGYVPFSERMEYGGKITTKQYAYGDEFDCPPDDIECQQQKAMEQTTPEGYSVVHGLNMLHEENPNKTTRIVPRADLEKARQEFINKQIPAATETATDPATTTITPSPDVTGEGVDPNKGVDNAQVATDAAAESNVDSSSALPSSEDSKEQQDFNIPNVYAGVDIPTAAYTLGRSIKRKDTLGTVASGAKLAAGLIRNTASGLGVQNRYDQVMEDYYKEQRNNRNPVQYLAYGGKKDEELATGEYMHGVMNEGIKDYNAEVEKGEYFQSNEGDIAEIVGDKHSEGGEKIKMEPEDRVVSDKLKIGGKNARMLSKKYDLKLKAKNTYSDVLDKFKKKSKLKDLIEEEADVIKKIDEQRKVEDTTTRDFNLEILAKKRQEILEKKSPIEEQRKVMFDELFNLQEESKGGTKNQEKEGENEFEFGGKLEDLAKEYNIPLDRAKELVQEFANGGKKKGAAFKDVPEGQSRTDEGFFGSVTPEQYDKFVRRNSDWFDFSNFDPSNPEDVKSLQMTYNDLTSGNTVKVDGKFGEQTASMLLTPPGPTAPVVVDTDINAPLPRRIAVAPTEDTETVMPSEDVVRNTGLGAYLFPDESPLPPSGLQGTIKPERRFDRVRPTEIAVEPYLQDIRDREASQIQSLEGLSPNVRAAVLANMRANSQSQESSVRNQIDTQNLQSQERAQYTNAQIQRMEENASEADRLAYEQRQYRAQALTDADLNNYYNNLQDLNKQRFMDIHNLNLINATNEDVYFDGQNFRRKTSDRDILRQVNI